MPKPWKDVIASPDYQSLAPDQQEAARQQYFSDVVAPQLSDPAQVEAAKTEFDAAYGGGRITPQQAESMTHHGPKSDPLIDRIRGNAAEDIPSVNDAEFLNDSGLGLKGSLAPAIAGSFGTDENVADALLKRLPGATLDKDTNGNPVIQLQDGKRFYVNQPGLDADDVVRGATKAASFIPAAVLAARGQTTPMRMLVGGLASGGTDAAMQIGATSTGGNPDLNPAQAVIATGLGSVAEVIPAVSAAIGRGGSKLLSSDAALAARGQRVATEAGIPGNLTQNDLIEMGRRYPEIRGGASPEAALAESEFGFNLTRGQKTGNVTDLRREEMLRSLGGDSGAAKTATAVHEAQQANTAKQAQAIQDYLSSGRSPANPSEAAQRVTTGVQEQADQLGGRISQAYDDARATNAAVDMTAVNDLPARLRQSVTDFDIHPEITPKTARTLDAITQDVSDLANTPGAKGVPIRAVEVQRKRIINALDGLQGADRAALTKVKKAFDGWVDDAFDNALFSGDQAALDKLKEARALRYEYGQRFQPRNPSDQGGKVVQRLLDENANPDQMATVLFGAGEISPAATASIARKLKAALGSDKEAWDAVRSTVIGKALTRKTGETMGPQAIVSNLNTLVKQRPQLLRELYTPDEIAKVQRFGKAMSALIPPGTIAKSSGTAERALAYFSEMLRNVPFGESMVKLISAPQRAATASRMMAPVRSPVSAGYTALGSGTGNALNQNRLLPGAGGLYSDDESGN